MDAPNILQLVMKFKLVMNSCFSVVDSGSVDSKYIHVAIKMFQSFSSEQNPAICREVKFPEVYKRNKLLWKCICAMSATTQNDIVSFGVEWPQ